MSNPKKKVAEDELQSYPQQLTPPKQLKFGNGWRKDPPNGNEVSLPSRRADLSPAYLQERNAYFESFENRTQDEQQDFLENLLTRISQHQLGQVNEFLTPMLQRDFITLLLEKNMDHVSDHILSYLDAKSLCAAEIVCTKWNRAIANSMLWKKLIERKVRSDLLWKGLAERRGWIRQLFRPRQDTSLSYDSEHDINFWRELYPNIVADVARVEHNWVHGDPKIEVINCRSENSKGVYCLQYDENKIISGLRDNSIKVWDRTNKECLKTLTGHTGSVLCLQFDEKIIVSGSSDTTIRVWDAETGVLLNTLIQHREAVLHLRFHNGLMVSCSKDRTTAVWDMNSPTDITIRQVLFGHRAAVNVVDFDEKYIVSASGDRTIKVWTTGSCEYKRTLSGHKRGIACLQYRDQLIVSGSSDNSIRLWDVESENCLRTLDGHEELVRCIRFDSKRIVSGAYDGKIKVWDLKAALDPRVPDSAVCIRTLVKHTGRVFRLQFDELHIISSSHDDTILVWDFLNSDQPNAKHRNPAARNLNFTNV